MLLLELVVDDEEEELDDVLPEELELLDVVAALPPVPPELLLPHAAVRSVAVMEPTMKNE